MASSSKTAEFQSKFTQDDSKSFFQVVHKRGQRVTKHMRQFVPTTQTGGSVDGSFCEFKLQKIGHHVDRLMLTFDYVWKKEDLTVLLNLIRNNQDNDCLSLVSHTAIRAIDDVRITFGGDTIELIDSDEIRLVNHLFQSKDEKIRTLIGTTGASGGNGNWVQRLYYAAVIRNGNIRDIEDEVCNTLIGCPCILPLDNNVNTDFLSHVRPKATGVPFPAGGVAITVEKDFVVPLRVEIPWSHGMSTDKNLPIALLDADPVVTVRFRKSAELIRAVGGPTDVTSEASAKAKFLNPRLVVEYRDQPGALLTALSKSPSITYPMSQIVRQRLVFDAGIKSSEWQITGIRGLVHSVAFMIRQQGQVEGMLGNRGPGDAVLMPRTGNDFLPSFGRTNNVGPRVYDYDALDFTNWTGYEANPDQSNINAFQRQLQSWYMTSNHERITGKTDIDASYCLNEYKKKYFPGEGEFEQTHLGATQFEMGLPGYNLYAYTFGLDGSRDAVGTGNMNFDSLQNILLHLNFRSDIKLGTGVYYLDFFGLTANFTTIAGGNWFRQLPP
jgi:hypothetical protein